MERYDTFDKACGTNIDTPHEKKYKKFVEFLGKEEVMRCIPFTEEEVANALEAGDEHLNTLSIVLWDNAAGFYENRKTGNISRFGSALTALIARKVKYSSCAECVCILKRAAIMRYENA